MQQLHLVGFTTDLEGLILSPRRGAKSGSYFIRIDDDLLGSIDDAQRLHDERQEPGGEGTEARAERASDRRTRPRPHSSLSPREIQARLRAGASIEEVANEAAVDQEWVSRFADPILAEQARVIQQAQDLVLDKARVGLSAQSLGTAVRWNLAARSVSLPGDSFEAAWSAFNVHGTRWVLRLSFSERGRRKLAEWEVDLREGHLTSRNRLGTDLGYVAPGRRRTRRPALEANPHPSRPSPRTKRAKKASKASKASKARKANKVVTAKRGAAKGSTTTTPKRAPARRMTGAERPTHLARPVSPMSAVNRSVGGAQLTAARSAWPTPGPVRPPNRAVPIKKVVPLDKAATNRKAFTNKKAATVKKAGTAKGGAANGGTANGRTAKAGAKKAGAKKAGPPASIRAVPAPPEAPHKRAPAPGTSRKAVGQAVKRDIPGVVILSESEAAARRAQLEARRVRGRSRQAPPS